MNIILIGGEKGGTGKTTLAVNLAALRALQGRDVLLIDTDVQASTSYWAQSRDEAQTRPRIACIQKFGKGLPTEVRDRIAYRKAARDGLSVDELKPGDPKAIEEMRALFREVFHGK